MAINKTETSLMYKKRKFDYRDSETSNKNFIPLQFFSVPIILKFFISIGHRKRVVFIFLG